MGRHQQNIVHQYHNGGIWPFVDDWRFTEWFHGRTLAPMGMAGQSWNAATFLLARRALLGNANGPSW